MKFERRISQFGWTLIFESEKLWQDEWGFSHSSYGVALLFYKAQRRLSVSIWSQTFSKNVQIFGPDKLWFEND